MRVHLWGTRGSIAVPGGDTLRYGGNTTCVEIEAEDGGRIIVDAGTGIRELGVKLMQDGNAVNVDLLITHIHWDHIIGFPFFGPIFLPSTRITVDGNVRSYKGLKTLFENRMADGFFPVTFDQLKAEIRFKNSLGKSPRTIGSVEVESVPLEHPGGGLGFRFREGGRSLVFLTDNELRDDGWKGMQPADYVRFCRGADVLIHDCQYLREEIESRRDWGHSDDESVIRLACEAEVGRLVLYHHDPARKDEEIDRLVERCRERVDREGVEMGVEGAKEEDFMV